MCVPGKALLLDEIFMLNAENRQNDPDEEKDAELYKVVAQYLIQLRALTIIRHIFPTVIASQQHRGVTLALLGGDVIYETRVGRLEEEIDNRLTVLKLLNSELSFPVKESEIESIKQEWKNVKTWPEGPILENFNLHSHFIEQQMNLTLRIAENSNLFSPTEIISEVGNYADKNEALLTRAILFELPKLIELIARIRGLATHASVSGSCDTEHHSRLEFLIRELNQKKEQFRVLSKVLYKYMLNDLPSLINLQIQDFKIVQLTLFVEDKILREAHIDRHNKSIFIIATNIISSHTEVVYEGLDYIQNKLHQKLSII